MVNNSMNITYLAFDLDGTLLNSKKQIPKATKDFLRRLNKCIILISSRHYYEMFPFAAELGLKDTDYVISSDGQYIFNGCGKLLKTMAFLTVKDVKYLETLGYNELALFTNRVDYHYKKKNASGIKRLKVCLNDIRTRHNNHLGNKKSVYSLFGIRGLKIEKIVIFAEERKELSLFYNTMNCKRLEITHKEVNKYLALCYLKSKKKIDFDQLIYFGDDLNDLEVFKYLKNTVAMGNAVESIYKLAKYHTTTCDNNGIEDFLGKQFKFK